jgi:hypothetical protein
MFICGSPATYSVSSAPLHVSPPPNTTNSTTSPGLHRPALRSHYVTMMVTVAVAVPPCPSLTV